MSHARYIVADGCWLWTGGTNNRGYGWWGRKLAHRRMYEELIGPIPEGLELDHLCRNRLCVNPDHLEPVTHTENVRRGESGAVNAARQLARTHCKRGHPFDPENTSVVTLENRSYRRCKRCNADAARRYRNGG